MNTTTFAPAYESEKSDILERIFGFPSFRPGQEAVVDAILAKNDVLAIMPTGGGKSLCYQLPSCILPGTCIVVSPLIALMKDQVDAACANGIKAASLTSAQSEAERRQILHALKSGDLNLLYISPERLAFDSFMETLKSIKISFVAIDEAHCICSWGHDFRPDYLELSQIIRQLPHVAVAAFTASATDAMQLDIVKQLGLREPFRYSGSFNRENLFYEVVPKVDPEAQIISFVKKFTGESGIVYRTTRESVEATARALAAAGVSALPYHAGLDDTTRRKNQEQFSRDHVDVVVATIAFGMGIDKSNVRYVVHGDLPRSLEHYYQETGRAGRDGDPAHCYLLFGRGDVPKLTYFIDQMENEEVARHHRRALGNMVAFASQHTCRRKLLLAHFGETLPAQQERCCDVCGAEGEEVDITREAQMLVSAIVRTGERFGMQHIINIVTGANTVQLRNFGHDTLKTWGVGKGIPRTRFREIFDALVAQEICSVSDGTYPIITLTNLAKEVLQGSRNVVMLQKKEAPVTSSSMAGFAGDEQLFDKLRKVRRDIAEERSVPPFVIFSDRTLHDMAARLPETDTEMLAVNGVGTVKLEQFGSRFLQVIITHLTEFPEKRSLKTAPIPETRTARPPKRTGLSETLLETAKLAEQGKNLDTIATERGLTRDTIANHIEELFAFGKQWPITQFIDANKHETIAALFKQHGTVQLKPVVTDGNGLFDYAEAKVVRTWMKTV